MLVVVVALMVARVPVAFTLLLPSLGYLWLDSGISITMALQRVSSGVNSFALLAVPLFIMAGNAANAAGITDRLFTFAERLLGHIRGSLGYVNVLVSLIFSWMSGAAIADAAGLGKIEVPAMTRRGYDQRFSVGLTGASGLIGPMMPPSVPAIIYAVTAGVSVGALFLASVVPALILVAALALMVFLHARGKEELRLPRASLAEIARSGGAALLALGTPVIVLGGILGGLVTPTEAAGLAVVYVLGLGLLYRSMSWPGFRTTVLSTAETTGSIMLIVGAASLFSWVLARERIPQAVAEAILTLTDNPLVFLILVNVLLLLIGMILEPTSAILVMVPVLLPVVTAFGIDPLHFGVFMILNLVIGLLTPPVGLVLYVLSSVTKIPFPQVARGALPFLLPLLVVLAVVTFVPALSLTLPSITGIG